jgi:Flp pilus assembly secretin CpaC
MNNVILKIICRTLSRLLPLAILLISTGCADFFSQKPTEIETRVILNELKQIKENPHIKNKLPELYRQQPQRLNVNEGVKVLYFTRQHPADKLAGLINEQFLRFEKDEKGVEQSKPLYIVTANQATNQLIFQCPSDEEADKVLEFLAKIDVPPIQVNIDCLILERFADVTMDWETTIKIENFLGEKIQLGGKVDDDGDLLPAFPGASLRESKRALFGLDLGYWKNQGVTGHEIRAIVDVLISRGYLRILMNPSLDTVNGQKGKITLRDNVPLEKIIIQPGFDAPFSSTEYQWVEDTLEVTPHVYADGSIGLNTKIQLGSKSKPEGVVQTSIITERTIEIAENRIAPGDSLVIGGMKKSEERSVVRGVPFLKDIPIIGILFSSKDYEEKATEVVFILTPSISSGGIQYSDMLNNVRKKRSKVQYEQSFQETLADPLGTTAYTERIERQAAAAEFESLKAQIEKAHAIDEMTRIKTELLDAAQEIRKERENVARARADVAKAENEAQKAKAEVTKVKKKATQTTKEAEELKRLLDELNRRLDTFSWRQNDNHQKKVEGEKVQSKAQKPDTENPTTDS